ncbi:MAG: hypothetical protein IPF88_14380 [Candidatus Microthrix sp.]|nr:hypothetical protein [Candidatus Microthrix sp.]MBK6439728.1 hypothetical protein [Candidatus Microthrix sp.]
MFVSCISFLSAHWGVGRPQPPRHRRLGGAHGRATKQFERLWVELNRRAHAKAVQVLRGDAKGVTAGDESVTISLVPAINQVLAQITAVSPELFGKTINIPDVSIDDPHGGDRQGQPAFGTNLPRTSWQITIYDNGKLKEAQEAIAPLRHPGCGCPPWCSPSPPSGPWRCRSTGGGRCSSWRSLTIPFLILMRRAAIIAQAGCSH